MNTRRKGLATALVVLMSLGVCVIVYIFKHDTAERRPSLLREAVTIPIPLAPLHDAPPRNPALVSTDMNHPNFPPFGATFKKLLTYHRSAAQLHRRSHSRRSRFAEETLFHFREARLLALSYPEEAFEAARRLALDPSADSSERGWSLYVLGVLAKEGVASAVESLYTAACNEKDERLNNRAVRYLYLADRQGSNRHLYLAKCQEGSFESFEAVSHWPDTSTISVMKTIAVSLRGQQYPACEHAALAEETLLRMEHLMASDKEERIAGILGGPIEKTTREQTLWALRIAEAQPTAQLINVLRQRLDRAEERVTARTHERVAAGGTADNFVTMPTLMTTGDPNFDDVLLSFFELGGKLNDWEKLRLRNFGYACDSKERLAELLAEHPK